MSRADLEIRTTEDELVSLVFFDDEDRGVFERSAFSIRNATTAVGQLQFVFSDQTRNAKLRVRGVRSQLTARKCRL